MKKINVVKNTVVEVVVALVLVVLGSFASQNSQKAEAAVNEPHLVYIDVNGGANLYDKPSRSANSTLKKASLFATVKSTKKNGERWYQLTTKQWVPASDAMKLKKFNKKDISKKALKKARKCIVVSGNVEYFYRFVNSHGKFGYVFIGAVC